MYGDGDSTPGDLTAVELSQWFINSWFNIFSVSCRLFVIILRIVGAQGVRHSLDSCACSCQTCGFEFVWCGSLSVWLFIWLDGA